MKEEVKSKPVLVFFLAPMCHFSCAMLHLLKWNIMCLCVELYLGWLLNENYNSIIAIRNGSAACGCVQSINWLMEPKTLQRPLQIHPMPLSGRFYTLISALDASSIRLYRTTITQALCTLSQLQTHDILCYFSYIVFR